MGQKQEVVEPREFNITQRRPRVLLFGNGMLRACGGISWKELVMQIIGREREESRRYEEWYDGGYCPPNPIVADAFFPTSDQERHNAYQSAFSAARCNISESIRILLDIPFDAILTTNYTSELEQVFEQKYHQKTVIKRTSQAVEQKFVMRLFHQVENAPPIWHMHGYTDKKSSMVFSHDEYVRLIDKIIEYNRTRGNEYCNYEENLKFKSWFDYFIMGDVYIIGCGLDYAESDLWWLLNRRKREQAQVGKIFYYEPQEADNKYSVKCTVLENLGVQCVDCGVTLPQEITNEQKEKYYAEFYRLAVCDLQGEITSTSQRDFAEETIACI